MMGEPGCGYSHAAIYLGSGEILESDTSGVKKSTVGDVLRVYDHIAVLRSRNSWSRSRIVRLKDFASRQIGKKFNIYGSPRIEFLRQESAEIHAGKYPIISKGYPLLLNLKK
ncbi:YiiX/YebB-like N1pC/P60 family cysteine hydrolase [Stenotrophomonas hibiscicola]|uniref:YiiX/YebB-like N1pC/P60 family cysteine hydrolase n=1 Tax=Stenotrophomonas hibiscicola TaxID=86189 RepID=UPI003CE5C658